MPKAQIHFFQYKRAEIKVKQYGKKFDFSSIRTEKVWSEEFLSFPSKFCFASSREEKKPKKKKGN